MTLGTDPGLVSGTRDSNTHAWQVDAHQRYSYGRRKTAADRK